MDNKEKIELSDILIQLEQIDYSLVVRILSPIILYYTSGHITSKILDGYKLHKELKPKNVSIVNLPPELTQEYSNIDIEKLASKCFGEAVVEFAILIIDKFPSKNLINFYNNINDLKIEPQKFEHQNTNILATYDAETNQIEVNDDYKKTIDHELFHMASSIYKNGVKYCGFRQASLDLDIGKSLNEGYTQLLTERYFGHKEEVLRVYDCFVYIADKVEKIVGQEKMERLYLNADLLGLINELKEYTSEEEIMEFISKTDFLMEHINDNKLVPFEKEMIKSSLKYVTEFLIRAYTMKLKRQLDSGLLDKNKFTDNLVTFISSLGTCIKCEKHSYEFLTPKILQEILKSILDESNLTINKTAKEPKESIAKGK